MGRPEQARDTLAEAIARAERLNMPALVAEARAALRCWIGHGRLVGRR